MDEKGFTPLMTAATYNAVECLDVLLEFEPDLDVINPSGKTALMLACQSGMQPYIFLSRVSSGNTNHILKDILK